MQKDDNIVTFATNFRRFVAIFNLEMMSFPRKIEIFVKSMAFYSKLKFWPIEGAFKNVFWPPIGQILN